MARDFAQPPNRVGEAYRFIARDALKYLPGTISVPATTQQQLGFTASSSIVLPQPRCALRVAEAQFNIHEGDANYKLQLTSAFLRMTFFGGGTSLQLDYAVFPSGNPPNGTLGQGGTGSLPFSGTWFTEDLMILLNGAPITSCNFLTWGDVNNPDAAAHNINAAGFIIYEIWQATLV